MAAGAVTISLVILLLAGTYTFRQQQHVNSELCASTVENRAADRVLWITLRKL
jgi:TRAP-type mannitol/chloroaromatic compound transport system permease small subunit